MKIVQFAFMSISMIIAISLPSTLAWDITFERVRVIQGEAPRYCEQIIQDHEGYYWIATDDGLLRYDGCNSKIFRYSPRVADYSECCPSRPNIVFTITEDSKGILWIGTPYGLKRFDKAAEKFHSYQIVFGVVPPDVGNMVISLFEDSKANFWVCTADGLYTFDRNQGVFDQKYKIDDYSLHDCMYSAFEDSYCRMWFCTARGLLLYDPKIELFMKRSHCNSDPDCPIDSYVDKFIEDRNGKFWLCSMNGIFQYNPNSMEFYRDTFKGFLSNESMNIDANSIIEDSYGNLIIAFRKMIVYLDVITNNSSAHYIEGIDALTRDTAFNKSLYKDHFGTIWLCRSERDVYKLVISNK